jgi:hypothetical protein
LAALAKGSGEFAATTSGRGEDNTYGWLNEAITGAKTAAGTEAANIKTASEAEAARIRQAIEAGTKATREAEARKAWEAQSGLESQAMDWLSKNPEYRGELDSVVGFGGGYGTPARPISQAEMAIKNFVEANAGNLYTQGSGTQLSSVDAANLEALQRLGGKAGIDYGVQTPTYTAGRAGDSEAQLQQLIQELQTKFAPKEAAPMPIVPTGTLMIDQSLYPDMSDSLPKMAGQAPFTTRTTQLDPVIQNILNAAR